MPTWNCAAEIFRPHRLSEEDVTGAIDIPGATVTIDGPAVVVTYTHESADDEAAAEVMARIWRDTGEALVINWGALSEERYSFCSWGEGGWGEPDGNWTEGLDRAELHQSLKMEAGERIANALVPLGE